MLKIQFVAVFTRLSALGLSDHFMLHDWMLCQRFRSDALVLLDTGAQSCCEVEGDTNAKAKQHQRGGVLGETCGGEVNVAHLFGYRCVQDDLIRPGDILQQDQTAIAYEGRRPRTTQIL